MAQTQTPWKGGRARATEPERVIRPLYHMTRKENPQLLALYNYNVSLILDLVSYYDTLFEPTSTRVGMLSMAPGLWTHIPAA